MLNTESTEDTKCKETAETISGYLRDRTLDGRCVAPKQFPGTFRDICDSDSKIAHRLGRAGRSVGLPVDQRNPAVSAPFRVVQSS